MFQQFGGIRSGFSIGIIFILSSLVSCGKNEPIFRISTFIDFTIPAGSSSVTILGFENEVIFPFETQLNNLGGTVPAIMSVNANNAIFYPRFDPEVNLDFINVIEINVLDQDDLTFSREVFHFDPIPFGTKNDIELFPSLPDIKSLIKDEKLLVQVELQFRAPPPRNIDIRIEMQFDAIEQE